MKYLPKILPIAEKIFLLLLVIGAGMKAIDKGGSMFLALALSGLACVYFLGIHVPSEVKIEEGEEPSGFKMLLILSILPRVIGISLAVSIIGIQFYLLQLEGSAVMLLVGGQTIIVAMFLFLVMQLNGTPYVESLRPKMLRGLVVVGAIAVIWFEGGLVLPQG